MTPFQHLPMPVAATPQNGRTSEAAGGDAQQRSPSTFRWSSRQLFGGGQEVQIAHGESVYRLRITSLGKLILTK